QRLRGRGVSACATCDGFFFRGKTVAVIGGGDTALEDASALTKFAKKIYIIHRRDSFRASKIMRERVLNHPNIEVIWNAHVEEVLGEQKVSGVKLNVGDKTRELALDGVFVAIGHQPDTELFKDQIRCDEKGYILTSAVAAYDAVRKGEGTKELSHDFNLNYQTATSQRGVFAAGVCVDRVYRQASTASGMGVAASLDAEHWLEE
ncbi:FAD-dependent oxidoreductase, partial [Candidatus Roizmanbacteria bacterium]|nr:FAD-dependent oxidoreductase [Candidatus Roizmanbacteria bacterium]